MQNGRDVCLQPVGCPGLPTRLRPQPRPWWQQCRQMFSSSFAPHPSSDRFSNADAGACCQDGPPCAWHWLPCAPRPAKDWGWEDPQGEWGRQNTLPQGLTNSYDLALAKVSFLVSLHNRRTCKFYLSPRPSSRDNTTAILPETLCSQPANLFFQSFSSSFSPILSF